MESPCGLPQAGGPWGAVPSRQAWGENVGSWGHTGGPFPLRIQEESAGPLVCMGLGPVGALFGVLLCSTHECPQTGLTFVAVVQSSKNIKLGVQTSTFHFNDLLGYFAQSFSGAVSFRSFCQKNQTIPPLGLVSEAMQRQCEQKLKLL